MVRVVWAGWGGRGGLGGRGGRGGWGGRGLAGVGRVVEVNVFEWFERLMKKYVFYSPNRPKKSNILHYLLRVKTEYYNTPLTAFQVP